MRTKKLLHGQVAVPQGVYLLVQGEQGDFEMRGLVRAGHISPPQTIKHAAANKGNNMAQYAAPLLTLSDSAVATDQW